MNIILNGKPASADEGDTLASLIARLNVEGHIAAQVNEEVIPRAELSRKRLAEGDMVELLRMMGGG
ncbi:MAG: sulfur carrier protein ThiS [Nitrospinae bacterium]|nr:sulfur carrier protein ThiS [Nitrospinota bacterium]